MNNHRHTFGCMLLACLLTLWFGVTSPALAQSSAGGGTIQGTVKDDNGGVIPGAKVIIKNLATGVVTNTVTNSEGFYTTPAISIGVYKVRVEHTAMKAWEGQLTVETGRSAEVNAEIGRASCRERV